MGQLWLRRCRGSANNQEVSGAITSLCAEVSSVKILNPRLPHYVLKTSDIEFSLDHRVLLCPLL